MRATLPSIPSKKAAITTHKTATSHLDSSPNLMALTPTQRDDIVIKLGKSFIKGSGFANFVFFNLNRIILFYTTYLTSNLGALVLVDLKSAKIVSPPTQICPT